jgi:hypothetical protein
MSETLWILWIILGSNGKYTEMTYVYARDEQHARERAQSWIDAHPHFSHVRFIAHPEGFQIYRGRLPGTIPVGDESIGEKPETKQL